MNVVLLFVEIFCTFGSVVLASRFFGKYGLLAWVPLASILANIMTAKTVDMLGLSSTMGTVLFASTFLATDILTENYNFKLARKAVFMGMFGTLFYIISSQIAIRYIPSAFDYAHDSMVTIFSLSLRISISSIIMYFIANMADVYIYDKLREKMSGRYMWLRNNVSTILCNCLENFFFMLMAFIGTFDFQTVIVMALSTSVIEIIAGICDTPFLYIATKWKCEDEGF